jgi:hypothetical protein
MASRGRPNRSAWPLLVPECSGQVEPWGNQPEKHNRGCQQRSGRRQRSRRQQRCGRHHVWPALRGARTLRVPGPRGPQRLLDGLRGHWQVAGRPKGFSVSSSLTAALRALLRAPPLNARRVCCPATPGRKLKELHGPLFSERVALTAMTGIAATHIGGARGGHTGLPRLRAQRPGPRVDGHVKPHRGWPFTPRRHDDSLPAGRQDHADVQGLRGLRQGRLSQLCIPAACVGDA